MAVYYFFRRSHYRSSLALPTAASFTESLDRHITTGDTSRIITNLLPETKSEPSSLKARPVQFSILMICSAKLSIA